ncbi:MAG TPA: nucleotide pyrophosphohydrolase [bacterium]|nr:nucleotide pyrophosphohydrolase [bacterium]
MSRRKTEPTLLGLRNQLRAFARERDWQRFHTPKNLAMSVAVEAAELLEIFQWLSDTQSSKISASTRDMARVREEMADVFIYLIRLADILSIDLEKAAAAKIARNARRYPVAASKGNAVKHGKRRR